MTVLENLQMGAIIANDPNVFDEDLDKVCTLFPVLKARQDQRGGTPCGVSFASVHEIRCRHVRQVECGATPYGVLKRDRAHVFEFESC